MALKKQKRHTGNRTPDKGILSAVLAAAIITGFFGLWLWSVMNSRTYQVFGDIVNRVETTEKVVALTFDDGPYPGNTERIMQILKKHDVKATFFVIGKEIERFPVQTELIVKNGHVIGNHSYQHSHMVFLQPRVIRDELEKTERLIMSTGASEPTVFRPPYGSKMILTPYYVNKMGMTTVMWDVAPDDIHENWGKSDKITRYTIDHVKPGSIIILHAMYPRDIGSLSAIEPIIKTLKKDGYRFVTVPELLSMRN